VLRSHPAVFSPGQQALRLGYLVHALMLDDEEEAAELCTLYQLPVERQGGESVAIINKVLILLIIIITTITTCYVCCLAQSGHCARQVNVRHPVKRSVAGPRQVHSLLQI
jgi:hypothetical protein